MPFMQIHQDHCLTGKPIRKLELSLHPGFDKDGNAEHIDVSMTFHVEPKEKGDVLFDHVLTRGPTPTTRYNASDIHVARSISPSSKIAISSIDSRDGRRRTFHVDEELASCELTVKYRALPRHVNELCPCGPQIALERDGGGLSACGQGFLLGLPEKESSTDQDITIRWKLTDAPPSTRAVSTFGEGSVNTIYAKPSVLEESFFMVGLITSHPESTVNESFGTYWLSPPPFSAADIGAQLSAVLPQVRSIFNDPDPLFRVFIRRNEYKCISGRGLYKGFVFAWNPILNRPSDTVSEFLFHEVIHNWPRLGGNGSHGAPTMADLEEGWWNEGIAEYYSLVIPLRLGILSGEQFVRRFNTRISGYYTNPDRALKNSQIMERFWKPGHANRIPYQRGFMHWVLLAHQLKEAGKRDLDSLVLEMVKLRRENKPHTIQVWLEILAAELGEAVLEQHRWIADAELIRLPGNCMDTFISEGKGSWNLIREDREEYHLGFPEACLSTGDRKVRGLEPASRAAKAGVKDGDTITRKFSYLEDSEQWDKNFTMVVLRNGEGEREKEKELEISWWPRSHEKVESYQFKRIEH